MPVADRLRIRSIAARAVAAPMKRPLATSTGSIKVAPLLLLDLHTSAGIVGRSYLWAPGTAHLARRRMRALLFALLAAALPAQAQIEIEKAWTRATAPGARVAAGYMTLRNRAAAPDRLLAASSPAAARVETHVHLREGEIVRMREVPGYNVPANGVFLLKPGGAHLMFTEIKRPFKEGEKIPLTLKFERAGELRIELHVGRLGASGHKH